MPRPSMREVLAALEFARTESMRRGSPDFIRQREIENRVQALCTRLLRAPIRHFGNSAVRQSSNARHTRA